ncbi:alpha-D-ribose 1-methylphosphonate 5-triphosphate synthase subunit PhnH [Variovorax sp. GrIS 2.14]|uniref:phosphonate C-P lyase system protein PhnH n=1 Tax=Variovorax sp. GrIS 2.14 TaxID=3071709 RepID=UPI0038F75984
MKPADLRAIGPGFSDLSFGSQAVFRAALHALSYPGRPVDLPHDAQVPAHGHAAAAALLLALLDPDCKLWLSPSLAGTDAAAWLRFHCGCVVVEEPAQAQFAWVAASDDIPSLASFAQGSDTYPDRSTTCVIEVSGLAESAVASGEAGWRLQGPGIREQVLLRVEGRAPSTAATLVAQRTLNHAAFPRGVDLFLATARQIVGLPRTTRIELEA